MSETSRKVNMKFSYTGTEFTRNFSIAGISEAAVPNIKNKLLAINASLSSGTDDGLSDFFLADDFDGTNGKLKKISEAQLVITEENYYFGGA